MDSFGKIETDISSEEENIFDDVPRVDAVSPVSSIPILPQLSVAFGLLLFVFGITYIGTADTQVDTKNTLDVRVDKIPTQTPDDISPLKNIFEDVRLEARSAVVWDVATQRVLFNKNADDRLPLASITKLMTALVAYELLDPQEKVLITRNALKTEGDSGLLDGEKFTVSNLTNLTLITSSNDGASALGAEAGKVIDTKEDPEALFVQAMNIKAEELGLSKMHFANSTGLDLTETEASAYGSARDVARLMEYVVTHITDSVTLTALDLTKIRNTNGDYHTAKNTNEYVAGIDGLIASKTGYTTLAGGNVVMAVNVGLNRPVVVAILGSSRDGRFEDAINLIDRTRTYVESEVK